MKKIKLIFIFLTIFSALNLLANDVKVTEIYSPNSPIISFRVVFYSGSINDPKGKEGLNALTARMLGSGGTKDLTYKQLTEKLYPIAAQIGMNYDKEITVIIGNVHRDNLDKFYSIFKEIFLNPRFDVEDFKRNKDILLNYIKNTLRGSDDEEFGKQSLDIIIHQNHPYGTTVAGTVQGLESITLDDVKNFYRKMYTKENVMIGITGGYPKDFVKKIQKDFSSLPSGKVESIQLPPRESIKDLEVTIIKKENIATAISFGYPIDVTRADKDFYALMIANSYLGEHRKSLGILYNHIREARGINYGNYTYIENFILGGMVFNPEPNIPRRQQFFSVWIRPMDPAKAHFTLREAIHELQVLVDNGIKKEDFELTRDFLINYSKLWVQTQTRRLGFKIDSDFYKTEYFIDKIEKEFKNLTLENVNNAIKKHLQYKNMKVVIIAKNAEAIRDSLIKNAKSSITYSAPSIPQWVLDEDKIIETYPLAINREKIRIITPMDIFEK